MTRAARNPRRAFTLVEILVVLGVILILVTLVVAVSSSLVKRAERGQTETALTIVDSAISEWEAQNGRPMTFGTMGSPAGAVYDIMELSPANGRYINVFLTNLLAQNPQCRAILATIPGDLLREDKTTSPGTNLVISPGNIYAPSVKPRSELVDTWGNRIAMVCAGRNWRVGDPGLPDADGTIRTADENALGVCENRRTLMISSGPDGLLGTEGGLSTAQRAEAIADNIYSYEPLPIS
ncbi:MAG: type II secretion system protein [Phycisphaerae bacterium]|nr:type II secretion system protein [Phycisphaerae bacterium]